MESSEQKEFVSWFKVRWPEHEKCLRVSLRGLNFGSGPRAARMVNYIKSQGSINGESDIALLLQRGGHGSLLVEHKGQGMDRKLTDDQREYLEYHNQIGNLGVSTRGIEELKNVVTEYMGRK